MAAPNDAKPASGAQPGAKRGEYTADGSTERRQARSGTDPGANRGGYSADGTIERSRPGVPALNRVPTAAETPRTAPSNDPNRSSGAQPGANRGNFTANGTIQPPGS